MYGGDGSNPICASRTRTLCGRRPSFACDLNVYTTLLCAQLTLHRQVPGLLRKPPHWRPNSDGKIKVERPIASP